VRHCPSCDAQRAMVGPSSRDSSGGSSSNKRKPRRQQHHHAQVAAAAATATAHDDDAAAAAADDAEAAAAPPPFPWSIVLTLTLAQFTSAFSFTVLFPFVPFMIVDIVEAVDDVSSAGLYSGFLISASQLGKILTAWCWGCWSDHHGRKAVIRYGLIGISIGSLVFGLADSFFVALLGRFVCGISDNIFGAAKTLLSEIVPQIHQSKAMALIGASWGVAIIFGTAAGGLLANPSQKYPAMFGGDGLFAAKPYLLPCLITPLLAMVELLLLHRVVPESVGKEAGVHWGAIDDDEDAESTPMLSETSASQMGAEGPCEVTKQQQQNHAYSELAAVDENRGNESVTVGDSTHWIRQRKPALAIVITGLLNCFVIADDDVMPLFAAAPVPQGGMGLDSFDIGVTLGGIGLFILVMFLLYSPLDKAVGSLRAFQCSAVFLIPSLVLTPAGPSLFSSADSDAARWGWFLFFGACKATAMEFVIIASGILVNNSVISKHRGSANGAAETASGMGRLIAPALFSPLFAWSVAPGQHTRALGQFTVFVLNALLALLTLGLSLKMPASIAKPP
jgi:MFS family permease